MARVGDGVPEVRSKGKSAKYFSQKYPRRCRNFPNEKLSAKPPCCFTSLPRSICFTSTASWIAMSIDDPQPSSISAPSQNAAYPSQRSIFSIPAPLKQLFDKFPLRPYPENGIPLRTQTIRGENVLYVFTDQDGAKRGRPSWNPACLKWQVRLQQSRRIAKYDCD